MKPRYKERIQTMCPVTITVGSHLSEGRILNLTVPGCLIESPVRVNKGDCLQLKMLLPGCKSPCSVAMATVRWSKGPQFGVEFIKMHESAQEQLRHVMARNQSSRAVTQVGDHRRFSEAGGQNWHLETHSLAEGTRTRGVMPWEGE